MVIPDLEYKTFVIYIDVLNINLDNKIYPSKKAQIANLKVDKVSTKVSNEYADLLTFFH